ncbi:putative Cation efflux family [Trypanosoma vivax]|uniref:Putative metal-ion transporter n=1 Tax=Trypanosoma vivax (strain Y486) TaxID=1055687 RepID=G0TUX6_TRYVY|nr:putative metal-ion transporter [Trypanosoma vivax]KAH8617695.1 putative Cation efflux family [Trypanosoma vivax]CCC47763.1 putative metal-ion transporter [Trypanosoma vivax Y486]
MGGKEEELPLASGAKHIGYSSVSDVAGAQVFILESEGSLNEGVISETERRRRWEVKLLSAALMFCLIFMFVEFACGVFAHSLALLTDASHLLIDVGAYALSIVSLKAASKSSCGKYSYGWHRAEVIGTLVSVFSIWALVAWISIEGFSRSWKVIRCSRVHGAVDLSSNQSSNWKDDAFEGLSPGMCEGIDSPVMLLVGILGMLVNVVCAMILYFGGSHGHSHFGGSHNHSHGEDEHSHEHGHSHDDAQSAQIGHGTACSSKNLKQSGQGFAVHAALLHALGDCVQSLGVIAAGAFIYMANQRAFGTPSNPHSIYNLADPLCSLLFAVITLNMTRPLIGDLLRILMEGTPPGINYEELKNVLLCIDGVVSVHDLHVWSLSSDYMALSVHLVADNKEETLREAQRLCAAFGIEHTTIQVDAVEDGANRCCTPCTVSA